MINRVEEITDKIYIRNVIVSVADKTGIADFIGEIAKICSEATFYSTGGTYKTLSEKSEGKGPFNLINIEDYTGQPEMQGGLVKTLDYRIYAGLLSEPGNQEHGADVERIGGVMFDMVVVNLYPFFDAIKRDDATPESARSHIDIGGPSMLRASAKNYLRVAGVVDPADYSSLVQELRETGGALSLTTRLRLATKVFRHTGEYDSAINNYLENKTISDLQKVYRIVD